MGENRACEQSNGGPDVKAGVRRWVSKSLIFFALFPLILFATSGRMDWMMGWALMGVWAVFQVATAVVLLPTNAGLIAERSGLQKGAKKWDLVLASLCGSLLPIASWIVAALNVRFGWPPRIPPAGQAAGLVVTLLGLAGVLWAMASNRFFSAVVRIQHDRGHTVATGGPYRCVRHPGYVGAIVYTLAMPVMLGSMWALIPAGLSAAVFVVRTALEDRTLHRELDGYRQYAASVRYRLLPGIW